MDPYRNLSEDEKIIIDSRLSTLEKALESRRAWGKIAVLIVGILILVVGLLVELRKSREERATCVDEVKVLTDKGIVRCDHPRQRGRVVDVFSSTLKYECTCQ